MSRPILFEVIATGADDARAAVAGGADRLEIVRDMAADGLTPDPAGFAEIRAAVDVPLRVMLRAEDSFAAGGPEGVDALRDAAAALRREGAEEFVLGFLTPDGEVDVDAVKGVVDALEGCRWTFHRAVDRVRDRDAAREALAGLPGLDTFLTAGSADGVPAGMPVLEREAGRGGPRLLVGGGLKLEHVPGLKGFGVDAFHVGSAVRGGSWAAPVDAAKVEVWRTALDG
ncbi:copper homeostasis protein CutC [Mangrovactinospora gilvigrisea]|uniref:Copper homeostasis protein cutC homolog n=1 Tax=Mangrovactinospora gilvigrisea TaxID=1428644 RepID=A0A1J7BER0_9ACTN|nr:copper homeostasis protein CutC [Mangrovactinospora gilvigrisea]OIV37061.1 copper homeostasis protein CutC [Mangrovactinospora gilvigrisea]